MMNRVLPSPEHLFFTHHARLRMVQRGITAEFVRIALESGWTFDEEHARIFYLPDAFLLAVPSRRRGLPGHPLIVVVGYDGGIVTVYWQDEEQLSGTGLSRD